MDNKTLQDRNGELEFQNKHLMEDLKNHQKEVDDLRLLTPANAQLEKALANSNNEIEHLKKDIYNFKVTFEDFQLHQYMEAINDL